MQHNKKGTLYVVATPIGNLDDITLRAIDVLRKVDRIIAEDTRHAAPLLKHFSIHKPTLSMHAFNENERLSQIMAYLNQGESIALISDAGTPLISDPGFPLVRSTKAQGVSIVPIPGPCALIAALSVAGLPTDRFAFEGFLPAKQKARCDRLQQLEKETRTLVFYEAPHRLLETLADMQAIFGEERKCVIARELTKIHESLHEGSFADLIAWFETHQLEKRGEIVVLVAGAPTITHKQVDNAEMTLAILMKHLPLKQAVLVASDLTGVRKNELYTMALHKKEQS